MIMLSFMLISCSLEKENNPNKEIETTTDIEDINIETKTDIEDTNDDTGEEKLMKLFIDGKEINVVWENNPSVKALKELGNIEINMHRYGGFEQVGSIGKSIISDDSYITTNPGDVILYSSNQIVIFFGNNSWSYTKLGHINLNNDELKELLDKENVVLRVGN